METIEDAALGVKKEGVGATTKAWDEPANDPKVAAQ